MPATNYIRILINNQQVELGSIADLGLAIDYLMEEPGDFMTKQGGQSLGLTFPATKKNDQIFNTYWNPHVEDMTQNNSFREVMDVVIYATGTIIFNGYGILQEATAREKPESYTMNIYSGSGEWLIDLQNTTLWDCVNPNPHTFDVATVIASWSNYNIAGDGSDDYVYAPVRYAQPFDGTTMGYQGDNCVNIYHLRPSISLYWLIVRAFQQIGFAVKSQFFSTQYFQRLVLPWVWGDFYDLNSQLVEGVCFKGCGNITTETPPATGVDAAGLVIPFWSGANCGNASLIGSAGGSSFWAKAVTAGYTASAFNPAVGIAQLIFNVTTNTTILNNGINHTGGVYVFSGNGSSPGGQDWFKMYLDNPPDGFDNFGLYSFDESTGTMIYDFNPPPSLVPYANISATFTISLYLTMSNDAGAEALAAIECIHIPTSGDTIMYCQSIMRTGGAIVGHTDYPSGTDLRFPLTPTNSNFTINNLNPGDKLKFRLRLLVDDGGVGAGCTFGVFSGGYLNNNPAVLGVPSYSYNPVTETFQFIQPNAIWTPLRSNLTMTGFLVQLGNTINLKNYDAFRQHRFLDMLAGTVDMFNLEVQTDPISKTVTFEPMFGGTLPTGESYQGYFSLAKILDYTQKKDLNEDQKLSLFNGIERQIDLTFKLDGNDGGQNIWGQRSKGIYLSNRTYTASINQNNLNIDNGVIAGTPGAARYLLPNRFAKGNRQIQNRFFSAVMHAPFPQWGPLTSNNVVPQLICIFPQNSGTGQAYAQSFEPKLAYYKGYFPLDPFTHYGAFIFIGDPAHPEVSPIKALPYMFAVNYGYNGSNDPVLSYSDENINGSQCPGLMSQFFRQRFAIMRNGQLMKANLRLNLNDITNWEHQESIKIDQNIYALIQIEKYNPLADQPCECTLWKIVPPMQVDADNSYPSTSSILTGPTILTDPNDIRYERLLLYPTDLPQIE